MNAPPPPRTAEPVYDSPLATPRDTAAFVCEDDGAATFPMSRLRLGALRDPSEGQQANFLYWLKRDLPDHVLIAWDFYPIRGPGLAIFFFAAAGRGGEDLFDPALQPRTGPYDQYHHGDIDALHVSYFRRRMQDERPFTTCNLRKSHGLDPVAQGADPIPSVPEAEPPCRIAVLTAGPRVRFAIGQGEHPDLPLPDWTDGGSRHGEVLGGGKSGFRQMAPLIAEYANLRVWRVEEPT